ncbi:hypothetical protein J2X45_002934 [Caulobacter sp. BE264]|nr:hypothetical protein [Caulobacter sp. BE264]
MIPAFGGFRSGPRAQPPDGSAAPWPRRRPSDKKRADAARLPCESVDFKVYSRGF